MKTQARPRRTSGAGSGTTTFEIKVVDPGRLELRRQIDASKRITRKIRDLPELARRLDIEAPGVSLQQLRDRLLKGKSAANKAIAKHDTLSKRQIRPLPGRNPSPVIIERAQLSLAEILARQQQRVTGDWRDWLQPSTCPTVNGRAAPFLSRTGATIPGLNSINHDSTAGYLVDQQSYLMGELSYLVAAWLNDDASAWRDDNPDCVFWYDNLCIFLPPLQCDSTVVASLSVRFTGSITSEADDHNEIRQCVYVAHSDENGILPPYVSFGAEYELNNIDLSGEIGLPYGNRIDSEWMTATMSFSSKSGTTPVVALANCTELRAQDGTLQIIGTWSVTDLVYSITPV